MTDPSMMVVHIQRPNRPETRCTVLAALEFNLSHLQAHGWEFPRFNGGETFFGSVYERDDARDAT